MKNRPVTTLFVLMSVDGKISTGDTDGMDFDKDLKTIPGVREGLSQYYELEKQTDVVSLNTGRVMAKIGINTRTEEPKKIPASFVIIDNLPHLTKQGVAYLSKWVQTLYLVTTHHDHPAKKLAADNVIILEEEQIVLPDLFVRLKNEFKIERITIQSGGTLNAELLRNDLIDHLSLVIAPCLIGGNETSTLIDGASLHSQSDLSKIKTLRLVNSTALKNGYLNVRYDVVSSH